MIQLGIIIKLQSLNFYLEVEMILFNVSVLALFMVAQELTRSRWKAQEWLLKIFQAKI
jgi:hypothetical protein